MPEVRAAVVSRTGLERALVVGRQRVGISVQQEVCVLREECRLPYGVIQRYLNSTLRKIQEK